MTRLKIFLESQYERLILWYVGFYVIGILSYFSLEEEPSVRFVILLFSSSILSPFLLGSKEKIILRFASFLLLSFSLGFTISFIRTMNTNPVAIKFKMEDVVAKGFIQKIKPTPYGAQITLGGVTIEHLSQAETPTSIRLNLAKFSYSHILTGDYIKVLCDLTPPAHNIAPNSYNFSQIAFFNKIGATGKAKGDIEIIEYETGNFFSSFTILRKYLYDLLIEKMGHKNGNFAAAMFLGETGGIDKTTLNNMRIAGVSHVLCVSGLHLSTVAFIFFISFRFILNLSDYIYFRFDIKKLAAFLSLIASFIYLILTGSQIAATRAFIMTSIFIISIIISKQPYPIRSLAVAAVIILTLNPEYAVHPSFQLSFIAVLSLLVGYEYYVKNLTKIRGAGGIIGNIRLYVISNIYSSLVASLATSPIVMYHFYIYSNYSLLANLIIVPLFGAVTMPIGILAIVLSKISLSYYLFYILSLSIDLMKWTANFVTSMPYSAIFTGFVSPFSIIIYLISFFWICFWTNRLRSIGFAGIIVFFVMFLSQDKPDILFNAESNFIAYYDKKSQPVVYATKLNNFTKKFIANWYGYESVSKKKPGEIQSLPQTISVDINTKTLFFKNEKYVLYDFSEVYLVNNKALIKDYSSKRFLFK